MTSTDARNPGERRLGDMGPRQQPGGSTGQGQNMFASYSNGNAGRRDTGNDAAGVLRQGDRNDPPEPARESAEDPAGDADILK